MLIIMSQAEKSNPKMTRERETLQEDRERFKNVEWIFSPPE